MINYIVFAIILLPLITRGKIRQKSLWISFGLLFLLFGCQYEMTRDWPVYVGRWLYATQNQVSEDRIIEPFYKLIMQACKPLTYFGYLMVCAVFNLWVIKKYLNKYVPIEWAWFTLAIFLLRTNFAFTYIDTNRQTLAITFTMLGLYVLTNTPKWIKRKNFKYIVGGLLVFAAINIHTSAVIAIPILFFPWICQHIKNSKYLWIFMGVYVFSYFVNFESVSNIVGDYMTGSDTLTDFTNYASEIAERSKSVVEQGFYFIILFLLILMFDRFKLEEKPLVLAVIVFISLQGYAMYTMLRVLFYYQIYSIYVIPLLITKFLTGSKSSKIIVYAFLAIFLAYCLYSFNKNMAGENMENWSDFKTIFSAPQWM